MKKQYIFIAGGIGITPFRSMIQYLIDKNIPIDITLFYTAATQDEFLFGKLFEKATKLLGLKTVYVLSTAEKDWQGEVGHINGNLIKKYVKDLTQPIFYISGPQPMVHAHQEMLQKLGIKDVQLKTDLFSGYEETYTN